MSLKKRPSLPKRPRKKTIEMNNKRDLSENRAGLILIRYQVNIK